MSRTLKEPRLRKSRTVLRLTHYFRRLGTQYSIRRLERKTRTAQSRLTILQSELRHQLLRTKELEQNLQQRIHRMQELYPTPADLAMETLQENHLQSQQIALGKWKEFELQSPWEP